MGLDRLKPTENDTGTIEDIHAEINQQNRRLDELDKLSEVQERSLWSGGSAGTNGVDEFVWDDDEDGFPGDADMLDADDRGNRERERMKREYQRQQLQMQQQALMIRMQKLQHDHAEAVEGRSMKQEGANTSTQRYRRRNQDPLVATNTPPRTPTSSGVSSRQQQPTPATPPQLKAYTASFFKPSSRPEHQQQQRSPRQEYHQRPGTAGSGSRSPGYKRQSLGRGLTGKSAGSPDSVDGAIFRMDGEAMDVDQNASATNNRASQYQQYPRAAPSYSSPTFAFLGKSRSAVVAGGTGRSPTAAATPATPTPSAMDKSFREYYIEAFRRCAPEGDVAEQDGRRRRRRVVPTIPTGSYY